MSSSLDTSVKSNRIIGHIVGDRPGPTVVFFGAIHGNEPAGVLAIEKLFKELPKVKEKLAGQVIGLIGNPQAYAQKKRYLWNDLNRVWNHHYTSMARRTTSSQLATKSELSDVKEIFKIIDPVLSASGKKVFVDLHTTSSDSIPFVAINDQLINRRFVAEIPVPVVLGIEEYLEGPLLSYLNDFGHVAFAFEAGQHDDPESVAGHYAFSWLSLVQAGVLQAKHIEGVQEYRTLLSEMSQGTEGFFEVLHRQQTTEEKEFQMDPGYQNFQTIKKKQRLANDIDGVVYAPVDGRIFMPLYQKQGQDAFFVVKKVPAWAMWCSEFLRKINFDRILTWFPGISMEPDQKETLLVNKKVARFFAKEIFHLLGYRRKHESGDQMIFSRREIIRKPE